ncbi:MAG TPA: FAD binding domain-containing protein [Candidatus Omnitrophota bacterium]|nr:FAD binding domain-containing protein [Candidatus Omnitrophota bacterium]HPD85217.1 FAD binding domain-containing protein [Candidatus Omnitrophota bacterium]HRZ04282.1 FAD binding domain-containing protein [Candidatus Omnitrophota bacterium]
MLLNPFKFHSPADLNEAVRLHNSLNNARILAGGTFVINTLKSLKNMGVKTPENIISLKKIREIKGISRSKEELSIRSMVTITELFESPEITENFPVLKTACRHIATNPIRNMATVGGNLTCRYTWTELGAILVALDAQMHFAGSDGREEIISLEEFFKNQARSSKILKSVSIKYEKNTRTSYQRVRKSSEVDVPLLAVCIKTNFIKKRFADTRVVINNGLEFARRDLKLETFLDSVEPGNQTAASALDHLDTSIYDTKEDDYKKAMFRVSIKNAVNEILQGSKK